MLSIKRTYSMYVKNFLFVSAATRKYQNRGDIKNDFFFSMDIFFYNRCTATYQELIQKKMNFMSFASRFPNEHTLSSISLNFSLYEAHLEFLILIQFFVICSAF